MAAFALIFASNGAAQSIPGAVLAKREPHHHLVYEDSTLRVLRVRVPGHDTTLLHEHDPDYFWIALGTHTVINAKPGVPDATIASPDLSIHYTPGKFAHVARNPGDTPFDNITVELLQPQTDVRNLCEPALAGQALDCMETEVTSTHPGVSEHNAFWTNHLRVSLATIAPGATLRAAVPTKQMWIIALDTSDVRRGLAVRGNVRWIGGTFRAPPGTAWSLANTARSPIRVIEVIAR
jgi:hypothetical protein